MYQTLLHHTYTIFSLHQLLLPVPGYSKNIEYIYCYIIKYQKFDQNRLKQQKLEQKTFKVYKIM